MKSSAYLTTQIFLNCSFTVFRRSLRWPFRTTLSNPFNAMLHNNGEVTPPCGIPLLGKVIIPFSIILALIHFKISLEPFGYRTLSSSLLIYSWEIWLKQSDISTSYTHKGENGLSSTVRSRVIASHVPLYFLNP